MNRVLPDALWCIIQGSDKQNLLLVQIEENELDLPFFSSEDSAKNAINKLQKADTLTPCAHELKFDSDVDFLRKIGCLRDMNPKFDPHIELQEGKLLKVKVSELSLSGIKKISDSIFEEEVIELKGYYSQNNVAEDTKIEDRNAAITHMYETRRDFIADVNRYYAIHLVVFAAILATMKLAIETKEQSPSFYYIAAAILCVIAAGFVFACRELLAAVYYLYAASSVTAAIKSEATGGKMHSWFDKVKDEARKIQRGIDKPTWWDWSNNLFFGFRRYNDLENGLEKLARKWSADRRSLLGINSSVHSVLFLILAGLGLYCTFMAWNSNGKLTTNTQDATPKLVVLSQNEFSELKKTVNLSVDLLTASVDAKHSEFLKFKNDSEAWQNSSNASSEQSRKELEKLISEIKASIDPMRSALEKIGQDSKKDTNAKSDQSQKDSGAPIPKATP